MYARIEMTKSLVMTSTPDRDTENRPCISLCICTLVTFSHLSPETLFETVGN